MHAQYHNPVLKQLRDQLVRYAPRAQKLEQVNRAEQLLAEIDPARTYTYEYFCYRITGYRPESCPPLGISGQDALHDLRMLVEDVSDAADLKVEDAGQPVHTVDERRIGDGSTTMIQRLVGLYHQAVERDIAEQTAAGAGRSSS